MTALDYALIVIVLGSAVVGLFRGLFREAMSLVVWIAAVWAAGRFAGAVAPYMARWLASPALELWAARLAVLIGVLLLGCILTWLVSMALHDSGLGAGDRAAGMAFGVARGVFLAGVVLLMLRAAGVGDEPWWRESKLLPYAIPVADTLQEAAKQEFGRPGSRPAPDRPARDPGRVGS